jgi:glycosyltransferase involved in cell wall biosynthesis
VSICIPASRDAGGLHAAVASVLAQDDGDLEAVITDDSCGELEPVARELGDDRVRYFANPRPLGLAGNHMAALARARGRYLGFLHDDDRFLRTYVGTVAGHLTADPSLGVVLADRWIDDGLGAYRRLRTGLAPGRYERFLPQVLLHDHFVPSATMVRREVWDGRRQDWPALTCGDLALFVDAALAGWPLLYVDEPLVIYRMHPAQIGGDETGTRHDLVSLWDSYRFDDPATERLRRQKLAHWLVARAGAHLKEGRPAEADADLRRARELDRRRRGPREHALSLLAAHPALVPVAHRAWRRLRPRPRVEPLARE